MFSLGDCFNLSELSLDMVGNRHSCILTTSVNILLTLNPIQHSRLESFRLTTKCAYQWLDEGSRSELVRAWGNLDTVLSELAKVVTERRGKRLTFVLASTGKHEEGCISFGRKRLPDMLPRFCELGSLHLDYGGDRLAPNGARPRPYGPNCMKLD